MPRLINTDTKRYLLYRNQQALARAEAWDATGGLYINGDPISSKYLTVLVNLCGGGKPFAC